MWGVIVPSVACAPESVCHGEDDAQSYPITLCGNLCGKYSAGKTQDWIFSRAGKHLFLDISWYFLLQLFLQILIVDDGCIAMRCGAKQWIVDLKNGIHHQTFNGCLGSWVKLLYLYFISIQNKPYRQFFCFCHVLSACCVEECCLGQFYYSVKMNFHTRTINCQP